jgi:hypothetical protein
LKVFYIHKEFIVYVFYTCRLLEICFHFTGHRSSTQEFFAGPSEFLPDLHLTFWFNLDGTNDVKYRKRSARLK